MERVRFIEHRGQRVLLIDFLDCGPDEVIDITNQVLDVVTSQARDSVLIVADFTGAKVTKDAAQRIKEVAAQDVPYVRRAAWVRADVIPPALLRGIEAFSTRKFEPFATRQEALDWIVEEEAIASGQ